MIETFQIFKRATRLALLVASGFVGAAILSNIITNPVSAWGPERPTYTNKSPAPYATFNSITDSEAIRDERNFVRIREAGTDQTYQDEIEIVPGKEYEVYIYYHNDAASDTNESGFGMATNTKVSSAYPTTVNSSERGMISGIITWSYKTPEDPTNAKEGKVWDEAYVTTKSENVVLRYKTGTAIIHNGGTANGSVLPSNLFTEAGTPIGFNKLEGVLPGCAKYSGYITYTLIAESTTADFSKQVSLDGENWSENVTVKPGQIVTYQVILKNTGNTDLKNVIFKDVHDEGLSLYAGSTKVYDVNNVDGKQIDDILDISGHSFGDVAPDALVQIIYQARVGDDIAYCGKTLNNAILLSYNSEDQGKDTASVTVSCDTPVEEDCTTNPNLEGCSQPEKNCKTNPEMEGCQELPNTGPLEVILAIVIIAGIGGGGYYLYRTQRTLKTVEDSVSGKVDSDKDDKNNEKTDKEES